MKSLALFSFLLFTINSIAQTNKDLAIEYYKRAQTAFDEKKIEDAEKYADKCAELNISEAEEGLTYLQAKIAFEKKEYESSYNLVDKYFSLEGLKTSESKKKRYSEMVSLKINLQELLEKDLTKLLEGKMDASKYASSGISDFIIEKSEYGDLFLIGNYKYRKTKFSSYYMKNLKSLAYPDLIPSITQIKELSDIIVNKDYFDEVQDLVGTDYTEHSYWFNNNGETGMITIRPGKVEIKTKSELSTYQKNNLKLPFLEYYSTGLSFSVSKSNSNEIGKYFYEKGEYGKAMRVFLENPQVSKMSHYREIFRAFWGSEISVIRDGVNKYFDMLRTLNHYFVVTREELHKSVDYLFIKKQILEGCLKWYKKSISSGKSCSYEVEIVEGLISDLESKLNRIDPDKSDREYWRLDKPSSLLE